ncbi:MAG: glutathione S-transferase N-terminal domain-containing protein [Parvibaculum sp.]
MKLFSSPTSPFARKVRVLIREKGATNVVPETTVSAMNDPEELLDVNPLGKVPALETAEGTTLFNSPLICQYLDETLPGVKFFPPIGPDYWKVMRLLTIGDGISEAAFSLTMEKNRPDAERSSMWMGRWQRAITRSLDLLEKEASDLQRPLNLGVISVGCALGYLDFRHGNLEWRNTRPALAAIAKEIFALPSFKETEPA